MDSTDARTGLDFEQVARDYERWICSTAAAMIGRRLSSSAFDADDLAQEGRIALWSALASYNPDKGSLASWVTLKARGRMVDVLREAPTKRQITIEFDPVAHDRSDGLDVGAQVCDADEAAGACARVRESLACLTPRQRQYVTERFWHQASPQALKDVFGYDPQALWSSKKNGARLKLAAALST